MPEYDNNMRGVLFKNDRKETDNHPDYKGNAEINGVQYWVSGWIKTPNAGGQKFMSLSFKAKDEQPPAQPPRGQSAPTRRTQEPQASFADGPHRPLDDGDVPF